MLLILNLRHDVPSYYFFFIRIKLYAKKKILREFNLEDL